MRHGIFRAAGLIVLALTELAFSQTVTIRHEYYTTVFSETLRIPIAVKWWLTKKEETCSPRVKRTDRFAPDPKLRSCTNLTRDYSRSGYDRGHNMPAEDNVCSAEGMKECFYYSNMCPQTPSLNRGAWKRLETYCRALAREYDSVLVWSGSVCRSGKTIGPDRVGVPDYCWKIVFVKKTGETYAYSFRNDDHESEPISFYRVSLDSVERLSWLKFRYH